MGGAERKHRQKAKSRQWHENYEPLVPGALPKETALTEVVAPSRPNHGSNVMPSPMFPGLVRGPVPPSLPPPHLANAKELVMSPFRSPYLDMQEDDQCAQEQFENVFARERVPSPSQSPYLDIEEDVQCEQERHEQSLDVAESDSDGVEDAEGTGSPSEIESEGSSSLHTGQACSSLQIPFTFPLWVKKILSFSHGSILIDDCHLPDVKYSVLTTTSNRNTEMVLQRLPSPNEPGNPLIQRLCVVRVLGTYMVTSKHDEDAEPASKRRKTLQ